MYTLLKMCVIKLPKPFVFGIPKCLKNEEITSHKAYVRCFQGVDILSSMCMMKPRTPFTLQAYVSYDEAVR